MTRSWFTLLLLFTPPAPASPRTDACLRLLDNIQSRPAPNPADVAEVVRRFNAANGREFKLNWASLDGHLSVDFTAESTSQSLLTVASALALAHDGRAFVNRETYDPRHDRPADTPTFTLMRENPVWFPAAEYPADRWRAITPEPQEARRLRPVTSTFAGFTSLLLVADRYAFVSTLPQRFLKLEVSDQKLLMTALETRMSLMTRGRAPKTWR